MKQGRKEIIYSINIDDVQKVSNEVFNRTLTRAEIASVEDVLGDYIEWHSALETAIRERISV